LGPIEKLAFEHITEKEKIKELSVVLYPDSFFSGFWDAEQQLCVAAEHNIESFKTSIARWHEEYVLDNVQILSTHIPYLHMPQEVFAEKNYEQYFEGIYDLRKCRRSARELDINRLQDINTLHYIPNEVIEALKASNIPFRLAHLSTAMLNYAEAFDADVVCIIKRNKLHILARNEEQFCFYNSFYCVDINDFLYFSLMVLQQFGLDQSHSRIHFAGDIDRSAKLYIQLRYHIPALRVIDDVFKTHKPTIQPRQVYFELFLSRTCV
jgi:hypothetical protein